MDNLNITSLKPQQRYTRNQTFQVKKSNSIPKTNVLLITKTSRNQLLSQPGWSNTNEMKNTTTSGDSKEAYQVNYQSPLNKVSQNQRLNYTDNKQSYNKNHQANYQVKGIEAFDQNAYNDKIPRNNATMESSADLQSQTNYTKQTPVTASKTNVQRNNFGASNESAQFQTMNSGFYKKEQMYKVQGNGFKNKNGTLPSKQPMSQPINRYEVYQSQYSIQGGKSNVGSPDLHNRSVVFMASPNIGLPKQNLTTFQSIIDYNEGQAHDNSQSKSAQKAYFNHNRSSSKNQVIYQNDHEYFNTQKGLTNDSIRTANKSRNGKMIHNYTTGNKKNYSNNIRSNNSVIINAGTQNQNNNSLLLKILNLKQYQLQSSHDGSPLKDDKMDSQIESHKLNTSLNKFFQKRKEAPDFNSNQQQKQAITEIKQSRNNLGKISHTYQSNQNPNASFYSQVKRKDYLEKQQKEFIESLGIKNSYYIPGDVNFLERNLREIANNSHNKSYMESETSKLSVADKSFETGKKLTDQSPLTKKRVNPYVKKEQKFKKIYEEKLVELRGQQNTITKPGDSISSIKQLKPPDISLYKERNDPYQIISNRIKTRAQMIERKYLDKNVKILEKFFDPLRIRIRVMPVSRAPLVQGKNSDYYFIEAAKLSLKGDLTNAIEQLKKGLELKPTHFLCRFNHGVLMFKLGLIQEATSDFEILNRIYGLKEPASTYNLAICYAQSGKYQEGNALCSLVIESLGKQFYDKELLQDAFKLKGICSFRLGDAIESIKSYNLSNKYRIEAIQDKQDIDDKNKQMTGYELECIYIDLFIEETKHIFQDSKFQQALMKASKSQKHLRPLLFDMHQFKRFGSEKNLDVKTQKNFQIKLINQNTGTAQIEDCESLGQNSDRLNQQDFNKHILIMDKSSQKLDVNHQRQPSKSMKKANRPDHRKNYSLDLNADKDQKTEAVSPNNKNKSIRNFRKVSYNDFSSLVNNQLHNTKKLTQSIRSRVEKEKLKKFVGITNLSVLEANQFDLDQQKSKIYEDQIYNELRDTKNNIINAGSKYRLEKIYGISTEHVNSSSIIFDDITEEEKKEIDKRRRIEAELNQSSDNQQLKLFKEQEQQDDKFLQFLLGANEIKMRELLGTYNENSIKAVMNEQRDLENMLRNMREKFSLKEQEWEREYAHEQRRIMNLSLNDSDEQEEAGLSNRSLKRKKTKETVIDKLNKSLIDNEVTPDDIQNILIRDRDEKQIKENQSKYQLKKQRKRLALRQVEVIRREFANLKENENQKRTIKQLDQILQTLKFFQRFDEATRSKIYLNSELLTLDAQTVIFNQGDVGDKLYIILKGRVAVQVNSPDYGNLPVVVATLNDGEQFGELSLIKLNKLQDHSKQGEIQIIEEKSHEEFAKRKATCIAVETTDLLTLPKEISIQLYQPDAAPKRKSRATIPTKNARRKTIDSITQEEQDELNQKIQFLQSLALFEEIDAELLMPIAVNMIPCTFNFGEYVIKEGEIPKGLYIIKSGQCKVACRRIAERNKNENEQGQLNKKLGEKKKIKDKHPLFNDYDPDNSILNEVKSMNKVFQNDRIYVSGTGDQVKGKIVYQDIMTFSQLMPKNFFGGRVLLPFEMYINLRRIYFGQEDLLRYYPKSTPQTVIDQESEEHFQMRSLLSVIADSGQVEVYVLDRNDMSFIPDFIVRRVYEKIALTREPDRPYNPQRVEEIKDAMIKWDKYKVKCVEKLFKEKQLLEKNSQIR